MYDAVLFQNVDNNRYWNYNELQDSYADPDHIKNNNMIEQILEILEKAGAIITEFAVLVIVVGFVLATVRYFLRFRKLSPEENFITFKIALGTALLLGLEILILADVIDTITVESTYQSLAALAFIVVLRTAVSWTLALEIEGHWPWQAESEEQGNV
jgi:uncharacterized membrane protein